MDFPGKNTGVGCHSLLQGIFPTQGLNSGLPHCRQNLYHLNCLGSPQFSFRIMPLCLPARLTPARPGWVIVAWTPFGFLPRRWGLNDCKWSGPDSLPSLMSAFPSWGPGSPLFNVETKWPQDRLKNVSGPDLRISHIKQPSGKDLGVARGRMNRKLSSP